MRLITISRQFGSGGRELGKRISDILGWDYYDKEIIQRLADDQGLDPDYVKSVLSNHGWNSIPMTFRSSFSSAVFSNDFNGDIVIFEELNNFMSVATDFIFEQGET